MTLAVEYSKRAATEDLGAARRRIETLTVEQDNLSIGRAPMRFPRPRWDALGLISLNFLLWWMMAKAVFALHLWPGS
jgi:hypothetical protein